MLKLTPSRVRDYDTCPLKFKLLHLDRIAPPSLVPSSALALGRSIHRALDERHRPGNRSTQFLSPDALLRRHWRVAGYTTTAEESVYFKTGVQILTQYFEFIGQPEARVLGTEVFLSRILTLDGLRVEMGCKADRLDLHPNGTLEVLDYKTDVSGQVPTAEVLAADLPTFIYYLLARVAYPNYPHVVVSQLNVRSLAKVVVDYDEAQIAANKRGLVDLAHEIAVGGFDPRPNGACAWCPVRDHCPAFGPTLDLDEII